MSILLILRSSSCLFSWGSFRFSKEAFQFFKEPFLFFRGSFPLISGKFDLSNDCFPVPFPFDRGYYCTIQWRSLSFLQGQTPFQCLDLGISFCFFLVGSWNMERLGGVFCNQNNYDFARRTSTSRTLAFVVCWWNITFLLKTVPSEIADGAYNLYSFNF